MFDCYSFGNDGSTNENQMFDYPMGVRGYAAQYGKPFWSWMQSFAGDGMTYMPSESQMRMRAFSTA